MDHTREETAPGNSATPIFGYVMIGSLIIVPVALRGGWSVVANFTALVSGTAGLLHVHARTMNAPVRTGAMIDERDYTLLLLGVGAFLGADYVNYRVTAYFLVAGVLASYWNGKVAGEKAREATRDPEHARQRVVDTRGEGSEAY